MWLTNSLINALQKRGQPQFIIIKREIIFIYFIIYKGYFKFNSAITQLTFASNCNQALNT